MGKIIEPNPFWDSASTIRCSVTGEDATKYHDPATQTFEGNNNRSVASLLPSGGHGIRGTVIPRATKLGGSRGFDAHKPRYVVIDPDIKGESCIVDLTQITKEKMAAAVKEAEKNPNTQDDLALKASQIYHNLSSGYESPITPSSSPVIDNRRPPSNMPGYVVPRATLGGRQIIDQPAAELNLAPQNLTQSPVVTQRSDLVSTIESTTTQIKSTLPTIQVTFELNVWGKMTAFYHEVVKNDSLLILCWDNRYNAGVKYFPPEIEDLMAVHIGNTVYFVYSSNSTFTHNEYDYCILVIEQEKNI